MSHPNLAGCTVQPIDVEAYFTWLLGEPGTDIPKGAAGMVWALAHCDDGVTWGRRNSPGISNWILGSQLFPDICPTPQRERLQEIRIFSKNAEVLIWRTDVGFRGRVLRESDPPVDRNNGSDPLRPSDEYRIIRGNRLIGIPKSGFSYVADGTGAEQVIPIEVSDQQLEQRSVRLCVRHYYEQDDGTGSVRIAATRLVKLTSEGRSNVS